MEKQLQSSNADLQNMKCMVQNIAESMQAMQSMMMVSQASANVVASDLAVEEEAQKSKVERPCQLNQLIVMVPVIVPVAISLRNFTRRNKPRWCPV